MTSTAAWRRSEDDMALWLVVDDVPVIEVSRWSDNKTGEHMWWGVEWTAEAAAARGINNAITIKEHFLHAYEAAVAAASVSIAAPEDIVKEWLDQPIRTERAPVSTPETIEGLTNIDFARRAASIASTGSLWARDILNPYDEGAANLHSVETFVAEIEGKVAALRKAAGLGQR